MGQDQRESDEVNQHESDEEDEPEFKADAVEKCRPLRSEIERLIEPHRHSCDQKPPFSVKELIIMAVICSDTIGTTKPAILGWISHEIFNDRFRMASTRRIAADGERSLIAMTETARGRTPLPPRCETRGTAFLEFAGFSPDGLRGPFWPRRERPGALTKSAKLEMEDPLGVCPCPGAGGGPRTGNR